MLFISAVALAIAAIPEALPTVTADDPVARRRRPGQAQRHRQGPPVGRDARVHLGDQLRQDRHADDEPDDGRRGGRPDRPLHGLRHRLRPRGAVHHAAGSSDTIEDAILPYVVASDAKLVDGKVVGDPTEGALLVLAHKAGLDIDATRERLPAAGHAAVRPDLQADGDVHRGHRRRRTAGRAVLRQGRGAGGDGARGHRAVRRREPSPGTPTCAAARRGARGADGGRRAAGHGRGRARPRPGRLRPRRRPARLRRPTCR